MTELKNDTTSFPNIECSFNVPLYSAMKNNIVPISKRMDVVTKIIRVFVLVLAKSAFVFTGATLRIVSLFLLCF